MGIGGQSMLHHSNNLVIVSDARINLTSTTFIIVIITRLKTNFVCGISMIDFSDEELLFGSWRDGINIYNFKIILSKDIRPIINTKKKFLLLFQLVLK
ncbi:MAG: hypothetical protein IPL98_08910 [Saprospiraceae bacterium]|nr:hypothetical protein [Saprospiraceae bacterium]